MEADRVRKEELLTQRGEARRRWEEQRMLREEKCPRNRGSRGLAEAPPEGGGEDGSAVPAPAPGGAAPTQTQGLIHLAKW